MDIQRETKSKTLKRVIYGGAALVALVLITVGLSRLERSMGKKRVQRRQILFDHGIELEALAGADQFLQVLDPGFALFALILLEMRPSPLASITARICRSSDNSASSAVRRRTRST